KRVFPFRLDLPNGKSYGRIPREVSGIPIGFRESEPTVGGFMSWTSTLQKARTKFAVAGLPGVLAALRGRWYRRNQVYRKQFNDNGYLRLERFVEPSVCDRITREAEAFYARRGVPADKADRTMNFHQESPTANQVLHEQRLLDVIGALLGAPALFLQSIYFN